MMNRLELMVAATPRKPRGAQGERTDIGAHGGMLAEGT